jgi:sporulation protein YlmC with PRC-barrel domain
MKKLLSLCLSLLLMSSFNSYADEAQAQLTSVSGMNRASELIGMDVKNGQNESIGEIKDLVIDLESGQMAYAVMETDIVGMEDKSLPIPPGALTQSAEEDTLILDLDQAKLKQAPSIDLKNLSNDSDMKWETQVNSFYAQGQRANLPQVNTASIAKASDLLGMDVKNQENETVAEIKDLVIDFRSGRISYVLLSAGGFFGMGKKLLPVDSKTLAQVDAQKETMVLDIDKENIKEAASLDADNLPEQANTNWVSGNTGQPEQSGFKETEQNEARKQGQEAVSSASSY